MKMKQAVPSAVAVLVLAGLAALPATVPLFAVGERETPIVIHEAWARETPGGRAVLEQGGLHVMLMELRQSLTPGESFPLTLLFDSALELVVDVEVRPLRE